MAVGISKMIYRDELQDLTKVARFSIRLFTIFTSNPVGLVLDR